MLKNIFKTLVIFSIFTFLLGCKSTNSPKSVAETFLTSIARLDIQTARSLSTKQTNEFLKVLQSQTKDVPDDIKESYLENFKINVMKPEDMNDSVVHVKFTTEPRILPLDQLELIAEKDIEGNTKWKVNISTFDYITNDTMVHEIMVPSIDEDTASSLTDTISTQ